MPLYDAVKDLTLTIERVELEPHVLPLKHLTRRTTVFHLHGSGEEGVGEDVTYEEAHHQDVDASRPHGRAHDRLVLEAGGGASRATASGAWSPRRSTWRCARRAARSRPRSDGSRVPSRSSSRRAP